MTNGVIIAATGVPNAGFILPFHDWTIAIGGRSFGLRQWVQGRSSIFIFDSSADVPLSAPVTAAGFFLIVLLLLVAGYYLIANLRHKDAPGDA